MAERPIAGKVGLVGVASSGKTSLFCALTGTEYAKAVAATGKSLAGTVRILDPRLLKIHEIEGAHKKLIMPTIEVLDSSSIAIEGGEKIDNPGKLSSVRECDGYLLVLKGYEGEDVQKQLDAIRSEFILADIDVMQKRIDKLKGDSKKNNVLNKEELLKELSVMEPLLESVSGGDTAAFSKLTPEDEKRLKGFAFYSKKPLIPLANIGETQLGKGGSIPACAIKLEMELMAMEPAERESFMKDYGLSSLVLEKLAVTIYEKLHLQTFITTGDKDVTGWHLRKGATALDAAGRIHTDLAKGFINAEIVSHAEYGKWKNYKEAHARSNKRVEGKGYLMQDFDFVEIKSGV